MELLKNVYGAEIELSKSKSENKLDHTNYTFKSFEIDLNVKTVQVYLYGSKNDPYEVALIFEYPKAERTPSIPRSGSAWSRSPSATRPREPSPVARPRTLREPEKKRLRPSRSDVPARDEN